MSYEDFYEKPNKPDDEKIINSGVITDSLNGLISEES